MWEFICVLVRHDKDFARTHMRELILVLVRQINTLRELKYVILARHAPYSCVILMNCMWYMRKALADNPFSELTCGILVCHDPLICVV